MTKYKDLTPEEKKKRNRQGATARQNYAAANYEKLTLRLHKDGSDGITCEEIKQAASRAGKSANIWMLEAIKDRPQVGKRINSFPFRRSFYESFKLMEDKDRLATYDAIMSFVFDGAEPDGDNKIARSSVILLADQIIPERIAEREQGVEILERVSRAMYPDN